MEQVRGSESPLPVKAARGAGPGGRGCPACSRRGPCPWRGSLHTRQAPLPSAWRWTTTLPRAPHTTAITTQRQHAGTVRAYTSPSISPPPPRRRFCFTGGYVEAALWFPGDDYISGFWPAFWLMVSPALLPPAGMPFALARGTGRLLPGQRRQLDSSRLVAAAPPVC